MRRLVAPLLLPALAALPLARRAPAPDPRPRAIPNDNRQAAGRLAHGTLALRLVARPAAWRPDDDVDTLVTVFAFAEEGRAPRIPGPFVRVPAGTVLDVAVRNAVPDSALVVHGLRAGTAPDEAGDTLRVASGATGTLRVRLTTPGTYLYWGSTSGAKGPRIPSSWSGRDAQLLGAIVVDPPGARVDPAERTFVMSLIDLTPDSATKQRDDVWEIAVNGRSWPWTERLRAVVGDTMRMRWVNGTQRSHPMHLHGFHFTTLARGDGYHDSTVAPGERSLEVTELVEAGGTFRMAWLPTRAGNWLMHCHMTAHITPYPERPDSLRHHEHDAAAHARTAMAGLVVGITAVPRAGARLPDESPPVPARRLRLLAQERTTGEGRVRGFVLDGGGPVASDSVAVPGTPLVLVRGQTVAITVVNHLSEPTSVHWHGMELQSTYDGVAGWSGVHGSMAPLVAPGDSFTVAFTPPRAGTFMYHTHMDEGGSRGQLATGMYGAMLVLEPGKRLDAATDHVVMIGRVGTDSGSAFAIDGQRAPAPLVLRAGVAQRLRIVHVLPAAPVEVELRTASGLVTWRALAKDGATLPLALERTGPARLTMGVGETYDFTWTPDAPGDAELRVTIPNGPSVGRLPVRVVAP